MKTNRLENELAGKGIAVETEGPDWLNAASLNGGSLSCIYGSACSPRGSASHRSCKSDAAGRSSGGREAEAPLEYLIIARVRNERNIPEPKDTQSLNRKQPQSGFRESVEYVIDSRAKRARNENLVEQLCRHLEDRKRLEEAGLRDVYTNNNSIRLGNTAFVELFGVQERRPYTGKYDIMEARAGSIKFYTMIPRSER